MTPSIAPAFIATILPVALLYLLLVFRVLERSLDKTEGSKESLLSVLTERGMLIDALKITIALDAASLAESAGYLLVPSFSDFGGNNAAQLLFGAMLLLTHFTLLIIILAKTENVTTSTEKRIYNFEHMLKGYFILGVLATNSFSAVQLLGLYKAF